ncbi:MAG: homocysteine S-methyltransferase family protein [bacterium]
MKPFLEIAEAGGLLFDGAIGSLLYERGVFLTQCFEAVCLEQPGLVRRIHEEYLQAGARALTTNTFAANRVKLGHHGLADQVQVINAAAVKLAREAAGGRAYVVGSVGPTGTRLEDLAGPAGRAARDALAEQIDALVAAGVDALVLETFPVLQELETAIELARTRASVPVVALFTFQPDGLSIQRHSPEQVGRRLIAAGADVIGSNCGGGPDLLYRVTTPMVGLGKPVMAQANAGLPQVVDGRVIYVANPEYFGVFARRLLKAGVKVLGGAAAPDPSTSAAWPTPPACWRAASRRPPGRASSRGVAVGQPGIPWPSAATSRPPSPPGSSSPASRSTRPPASTSPRRSRRPAPCATSASPP